MVGSFTLPNSSKHICFLICFLHHPLNTSSHLQLTCNDVHQILFCHTKATILGGINTDISWFSQSSCLRSCRPYGGKNVIFCDPQLSTSVDLIPDKHPSYSTNTSNTLHVLIIFKTNHRETITSITQLERPVTASSRLSTTHPEPKSTTNKKKLFQLYSD